jgi:hypothetical protein
MYLFAWESLCLLQSPVEGGFGFFFFFAMVTTFYENTKLLELS